VDVRGGEEPQKWWVFSHVEVDMPEGLTWGPFEL